MEIKNIYELAARGVSLLVGAVVIILYALFVFQNPYSGSDLAQDSVFLMTVIAALAGLQIWGAWNRMPVIVIIAFIFSFIPTGMYMLGTPGVFRGIGIAHLCYLLIALLTWLDRRDFRLNRKAAAEAAAMHPDVGES
jgi:ribose/xylose/arabinose/galactoside ABC-type transport system permease subunit